MCGIFGILDRNGLAPNDAGLLRALAASMVHRGPDGEGLHSESRAAIGMRRLSIIDLEGGWQPLWNEDRSIALVANGEVYNFVELRRELEARGHRFGTNSDCETIIHLYEEHGRDCVNHLRGMFAFALLDIRRGRVLLVRDRLGEKPLFLHESNGRIVFASELASLVGSGAACFEIDPLAVHEYFHWGFVPEPRSPVLGTRKLPPAGMLEISLDPWTVRESIWWRPEAVKPVIGNPSDLIRAKLEEVMSIIVRSDVPVGVALSGGIDSSLIAALAKRHVRQPLHAFSIGYTTGGRFDESEKAAAFARTLGIPHHVAKISEEDALRSFAKVCVRRDEPISDLSGPAYLAVMELARSRDVPVMLTGQGSDELFWGYDFTVRGVAQTHRKHALLDGRVGWSDYARPRRPVLSYEGLIDWLLSGFGVVTGHQEWIRDRSTPRERMVFWDSRAEWWNAARAERQVGTSAYLRSVERHDPSYPFTDGLTLTRPDLVATTALLRTYLLSNGINQCDRLSMAASVECRLPFVDFELVELVLGLRMGVEDWRGTPKQLLIEATRELLPAEIFQRRKRGFTAPWKRWLRAIAGRHGEHLLDGELVRAGLLSTAGAQVLRNPIDGLGRPRALSLPAMVLEEWARGMAEKARASSALRRQLQ
ncbi:MAG: asparagine synthase (glutamine-hydrolyzing) [Planctomycetes bacterium]|nr:asparagine synthase (glutamine-hydrolyzing) [Planctomycetota bacterium]